jgi:hypothetical protein
LQLPAGCSTSRRILARPIGRDHQVHDLLDALLSVGLDATEIGVNVESWPVLSQTHPGGTTSTVVSPPAAELRENFEDLDEAAADLAEVAKAARERLGRMRLLGPTPTDQQFSRTWRASAEIASDDHAVDRL